MLSFAVNLTNLESLVKTGIVAKIGSCPCSVVPFRAEMDALRLQVYCHLFHLSLLRINMNISIKVMYVLAD